MAFEITDRVAPARFARITGGLYLSFIGASVASDVLGHLGPGDAQSVYDVITSQPGTFRAALVCGFVSAFLFLMAAWGLYVLLRPVNRDLALLFLLLNALGVAVQCASLLRLLSALFLGDPVDGSTALSSGQVNALVWNDVEVYRTGFVTAQLFLGTWLFPLGYLVWRSGFLPRFLGVLLLLDGVAEMGWFLQELLLPNHPEIATPGHFVSLVAEAGLALWLAVRGVSASVPTGGPVARSAPPTDR